jgi:tetratricopeptide (TPR) repeat protein
MRFVLIGLALLGMATPATAGVYSTIEPTPNLPPEKIREWVLQLRAAAIVPPGTLDSASLRAFFLRQAAALEEMRATGVFSTLDLINLSACYIRLGRGETAQPETREPDRLREAIRLLNSAPDRNHFLVQANLASAYFIVGDLDLAIRCQQRALDAWPTVWAYFNRAQLVGFRRYERIVLRLLEGRRDEASGRNKGPLDVDPIFPGLRFVGPGPKGEYEAGALSSAVNDRLPFDAGDIVLQLVRWYPQDMRLYWLLGELLNARGHIAPAFEILQELDRTNPLFKDLHAHFRVLRSAAEIFKQLKLQTPTGLWLLPSYLIGSQPGNLLPPGVGAAANAIGVAAPMEEARRLEQPQKPVVGPITDPSTQPSMSGPPMPFNWKHVLVGFAFGFLVAALLGFQWQEWRRRRMIQERDGAERPSP